MRYRSRSGWRGPFTRTARIFLVDCFKGNEELADSVNHLLVVGFYLVNIGFVSLYLKLPNEVADTRGIFEALSGKLGVVILVLGVMHFFNLYLFSTLRNRALARDEEPPVRPMGPRSSSAEPLTSKRSD